MDFAWEMDFDSFLREFQYLTRGFQYLSAPFLVSCLLQHPLPDLLVICVIKNASRHLSLQVTE